MHLKDLNELELLEKRHVCEKGCTVILFSRARSDSSEKTHCPRAIVRLDANEQRS